MPAFGRQKITGVRAGLRFITPFGATGDTPFHVPTSQGLFYSRHAAK